MPRLSDIIRKPYRRPTTTKGRKSVVLSLSQLESRDNPAVPVGLTDVSSLIVGASPPMGYVETHTVTRDETNTVTVDQSGSGSSGTFTIDVVGSAHSGDTASGSGGSGGVFLTASGTGSGQFSYHLVISGNYSNGTFTVTSETYTETGSYSSSQTANWTSVTQWDMTRSRSYTLSWTAAVSGGQLTYTSYSYDEIKSAYTHKHTTSSNGGYTDDIWEGNRTTHLNGSGNSVAITGLDSWHETHHVYYPNYYYGQPYDYTWQSGYDHPLSGATQLQPPFVSTSGWSWRAGTPEATNFTFHGVSNEFATLTESATIRTTATGNEFDVNSFDSTSHSSDSGHVIDDEPAVSGTGTELFHRNELYSYVNDVTGSGSYVDGSADADYQAVETGSFAVNNRLTVTGDHTTGFDDETGEPFDLLFNFDRSSTGNGSTTITHDYLDGGNGLELTGESFAGSGSSSVSIRSWGIRNGMAFDETTLNPESWSSSFSLSGEPGAVITPDGLVGAFPLQGMTTPNLVFFTAQQIPQWVPTSPVPGLPGQVQNWYNHRVSNIGEAGKKKGADAFVKKTILEAIQDNNPGGAFSKPYGVYTFEQGGAFAKAIGEDKALTKAQAAITKLYAQIWDNGAVNVGATVAEITYAVDQANQNPRSGNLVASYSLITTFTGTFRGQPITRKLTLLFDDLQMHDAKLEKMKLVGSP